MKEIDVEEAYKLIKSPVIIATKGKSSYDLTPIGWVMPYDYEPVTKALFASSPEHQADANIRRSEEFAILIPKDAAGALVANTGSVSGATVDKFEKFDIKAHKAKKIDVMIPDDEISAVIECKMTKVQAEGSVDLIFGSALCAYEF